MGCRWGERGCVALPTWGVRLRQAAFTSFSISRIGVRTRGRVGDLVTRPLGDRQGSLSIRRPAQRRAYPCDCNESRHTYYVSYGTARPETDVFGSAVGGTTWTDHGSKPSCWRISRLDDHTDARLFITRQPRLVYERYSVCSLANGTPPMRAGAGRHRGLWLGPGIEDPPSHQAARSTHD